MVASSEIRADTGADPGSDGGAMAEEGARQGRGLVPEGQGDEPHPNEEHEEGTREEDV